MVSPLSVVFSRSCGIASPKLVRIVCCSVIIASVMPYEISAEALALALACIILVAPDKLLVG